MSRWIPPNYVKQVIDQTRHDEKYVRLLLEHVNFQQISSSFRFLIPPCSLIHHFSLPQGQMPTKGWSDRMIEKFLGDLAAMDSNNFECKRGKRECILSI
jgi:hypothetical protein